MIIDLNNDQINLITQKQGVINATKLELNHAQEKLNLLIMGIATSRGITGKFTYDLQGNKLVITVPESEPPIEG